MDHIKRRIFESLNASEETVLGQGNKSRITTDPEDDSVVNVTTQDGTSARVAVADMTDHMARINGIPSGPARQAEIDKLVGTYTKTKPGSGNGLSGTTPIGEAAKRKADIQNELHGLFEGSTPAKDKGTVRASLVHADLVLIECNRKTVYETLVTEAVVETPNPVSFSFYVSRMNAPVIAEAIKRHGIRIKNGIRKIAERKEASSVRI